MSYEINPQNILFSGTKLSASFSFSAGCAIRDRVEIEEKLFKASDTIQLTTERTKAGKSMIHENILCTEQNKLL